MTHTTPDKAIPRDANRVPLLGAASTADGYTPVTLEADPVTHELLVTSSSNGKASDAYGINAISEDATYKYFWFEADDGDYYIMRKNLTTLVFDFTKGTGGYESVYVNSTSGPSGSPTWGSRGETF